MQNEVKKRYKASLESHYSPFLPNEKGNTQLWGGEKGWNGWNGWTSKSDGWIKSKNVRNGDPTPEYEYWESYGGNTSVLRSPVFKISGKKIRFWMAGYDVLDVETGEGGCLLRVAEDGTIVQEAAPPLKDEFVVCEWFVRNLKGKDVYLEVKGSKSFASSSGWLAVSNFEEINLRGSGTGGTVLLFKTSCVSYRNMGIDANRLRGQRNPQIPYFMR